MKSRFSFTLYLLYLFSFFACLAALGFLATGYLLFGAVWTAIAFMTIGPALAIEDLNRSLNRYLDEERRTISPETYEAARETADRVEAYLRGEDR